MIKQGWDNLSVPLFGQKNSPVPTGYVPTHIASVAGKRRERG